MPKPRIARWTKTTVRAAINPTVRYALRAGPSGKGQVLWSCQSWKNPVALDEAATRCESAEERYRGLGWEVLPLDEEGAA